MTSKRLTHSKQENRVRRITMGNWQTPSSLEQWITNWDFYQLNKNTEQFKTENSTKFTTEQNTIYRIFTETYNMMSPWQKQHITEISSDLKFYYFPVGGFLPGIFANGLSEVVVISVDLEIRGWNDIWQFTMNGLSPWDVLYPNKSSRCMHFPSKHDRFFPHSRVQDNDFQK